MAHTVHHHSYNPVSSEVTASEPRFREGRPYHRKQPLTSEESLSKTIEVAVTKAVLQASGPTRRQVLTGIGSAALVSLISEFLPLSQLQALAADPVGKPEKTDLGMGFIPITCATPIIMAEPMGFYSKHGLNAKVKRTAG